MPHHRIGAIDARAVDKKYYPIGWRFFFQQAKRTLAALASARLYLCFLFELILLPKFHSVDKLKYFNPKELRYLCHNKTHKTDEGKYQYFYP